MDLLKKAFTTPVKGEEDRQQISPETASGGAPPEQQGKQSETLPATDAAIAALQGFKYDPDQPPTPNLPPTAPQYVMFSPPAPRTLEPLETEEWPYDKDASPNPLSQSIEPMRSWLPAWESMTVSCQELVHTVMHG